MAKKDDIIEPINANLEDVANVMVNPPKVGMEVKPPSGKYDLLTFESDGQSTDFRFDEENQVIWASAETIANLFDVGSNTIYNHIQNIYKDEELQELETTTNFVVVKTEGGRNVKREVDYYNLDMILSVGYRVNAKKAIKFRQWATQTLKAYLEQGYVINEKALRDSPEKLNKLAANIRALRFGEQQIYAKVRECFKISSSDYNTSSKVMRKFYALLQDKYHHAITGMTSSKLILDRADHTDENMGLQTIKGKAPTLQDAQTGKNYLEPEEVYRLHLLSEQFLLFAESSALASRKMTMESLHKQLDRLLTLNNYHVFDGYKDFIKEEAISHARREHGLYKKRQKIESMGIAYNEEALAAGEYNEFLIDGG